MAGDERDIEFEPWAPHAADECPGHRRKMKRAASGREVRGADGGHRFAQCK